MRRASKGWLINWIKGQPEDWFCSPQWLAKKYRVMLPKEYQNAKGSVTRDELLKILTTPERSGL